MKLELFIQICYLVISYNLFLPFSGTVIYGITNKQEIIHSQIMESMPIIKNKVHKVLTIGAPTKYNSEFRFYNLRDITVAPGNRLYLLDSMNGLVIVVSTETGEELFKFGRSGAGPGEFSKLSVNIRYIPKRGIIIIDNKLRRATLFDKRGNVLATYPLLFLTDDLVFLNDDELLVSHFMLKPDFKPLHIISAKTGEILRQFGSIVEPQKGLFDKIKTSPFAAADIEMFSYGWMTRIIYLEQLNRLLLVQRNPYIVSYYDLENLKGTFIQAEVPFSTEKFIEYTVDGKSRSTTLLPTAKAFPPAVIDSSVVVPIFSANLDENYLDFYSYEGRFVKRFQIPSYPSAKHVIAVTFDSSNKTMYVLFANEDWINWIEKYKIEL